jgi:hypothetical protein
VIGSRLGDAHFRRSVRLKVPADHQPEHIDQVDLALMSSASADERTPLRLAS